MPAWLGAAAGGQDDDVAHGLSLRTGCAWGRPGAKPYRGTAQEALAAAGLPADVVWTLVGQVARRQSVERLNISGAGIVAQRSWRRFSAQDMAMTCGMSLCLKTRLHFARGHSEGAELHEIGDSAGRNYAVRVPEVCGNVSVIGAERPAAAAAGCWVVGAALGAGLVWVPDTAADNGMGLALAQGSSGSPGASRGGDGPSSDGGQRSALGLGAQREPATTAGVGQPLPARVPRSAPTPDPYHGVQDGTWTCAWASR